MSFEQIHLVAFFSSVTGISICLIINIILNICFERTKKNQGTLLFSVSSLFGVIIMCFYIKWNLALILIIKTVLYIFVLAGNVIYSCGDILKFGKENEKSKTEEKETALMLNRIKPHFIYNTLNTIQYLCRTEPELAANTISDFSQYLRGILKVNNAEQTVLFSSELEHVKNYLNIEKLRFQNRLKVEYEIETEDFEVPVLSVQPLVENAIKHTTQKAEITIIISAYKEKDSFIVMIKDNGDGFDKEELTEKHESLGLNNVKSRIKILFDGDLEIESIKGTGTTARLIIPQTGKGMWK